MRACWRLELFKSVKVAIAAGRLPWPADEIYEFDARAMGADPLMFYEVTTGASRFSHHEVDIRWGMT